MNRGARRGILFEAPGDYHAFLKCLGETQARYEVDLYAYCLMPNHFHLVCRPSADGDLARFMRRLTLTHSKRWHKLRGSTGQGAVYQGRYRASIIKSDHHFHAVCRYVERNPLRAKLTDRAEEWPWSSLAGMTFPWVPRLAEWPVPKPIGWLRSVNAPSTEAAVAELRQLLKRGQPVGDPSWQSETAARCGA